MNTKQANRMLHHAWVLRTKVDPKYFDMSVIARGEISPDHPCGTAACAIGYMPLAFPRLCRTARDLTNNVMAVGGGFSDRFSGLTVSDFYGLGIYDYLHLFGGGHKRTPKQQARIMEDFVRSKGFDVREV